MSTTLDEIMALADLACDAAMDYGSQEQQAGFTLMKQTDCDIAIERARNELRTHLASLVADAERWQAVAAHLPEPLNSQQTGEPK